MDNVRYNISPCSVGEAKAFIDKIDTSVYNPRGFIAADGKCHYDRYSYMCDDSKVAVVYDVTACVISITGRAEHSEALLRLYAPSSDKTVKRSTVPAQGSITTMPNRGDKLNAIFGTAIPPVGYADRGVAYAERQADGTQEEGRSEPRLRSRVFVSPDALKTQTVPQQSYSTLATARGHEISTDEIFPPQRARKRVYPNDGNRAIGDMSHSVIANARGQEISTDEIYPPQIAKKKPQPYPESASAHIVKSDAEPIKPASVERSDDSGINISLNVRKTGMPRRAVISFGDDDDDFKYKSDTKINTRAVGLGRGASEVREATAADQDQPKRKRGRPPKIKQPDTVDAVRHAEISAEKTVAPEYKNGYSVKNYPQTALAGLLKRLKSFDRYKVVSEGVEFGGTPQEIKAYSVCDPNGQKVILRYAVGKMTLQLQGKRSELFGEVQSQISQDSDYSSALEGYVEASVRSGSETAPKTKVSDVQNKLKKRLPTAYEYLSEQSRIDFSYGIHDFGQTSLKLSDYSVLLVPPFRGLERFVFDLQRSEGIKVKMIGQAYDKNERGNYILKSGYQQRINSVVYCEVMVSLYTEYFSRRNFFAHSDNSDENLSRAIPDRNVAKQIFDRLLDVVEYNAKKLKEIGYTVKNRT